MISADCILANGLLFINVWIFSLIPLALAQKRVKEELKAQRIALTGLAPPKARLHDTKCHSSNSFKLNWITSQGSKVSKDRGGSSQPLALGI